MDLGLDMKDLVVPMIMLACYGTLMAIFFVASNYYPILRDKKDTLQRAAIIISFMAIPLVLIIWGTISGM